MHLVLVHYVHMCVSLSRCRTTVNLQLQLRSICDWICKYRSYRPRQEVRFFHTNTKLNGDRICEKGSSTCIQFMNLTIDNLRLKNAVDLKFDH